MEPTHATHATHADGGLELEALLLGVAEGFRARDALRRERALTWAAQQAAAREADAEQTRAFAALDQFCRATKKAKKNSFVAHLVAKGMDLEAATRASAGLGLAEERQLRFVTAQVVEDIKGGCFACLVLSDEQLQQLQAICREYRAAFAT